MNPFNSEYQEPAAALIFRRLAAILAALAVGLGAFGAHALKDQLSAAGMTDVWEKAHLYHIVHAIALFALSMTRFFKFGPACLILAGITLFSGSLYGLALSDWKWLGPVTPFGGTAFIMAWIWLAAPTKK